MTEPGKAAYPQVLTMPHTLRKLLRAGLTKRHTKPAWKWTISRDLQPSRGGEEEAAAKRGGCKRWSQVVNKCTRRNNPMRARICYLGVTAIRWLLAISAAYTLLTNKVNFHGQSCVRALIR